MKVVIITEGGSGFGFGHITRCMSLYETFSGIGADCLFIVNGGPEVKKILKGKNLRILDWVREKNRLFGFIRDFDVGIIDSYIAGHSIYKALSESVKIPVYIDDNIRLDYPRGIVINGNIYAPSLPYPRTEGRKYLLGRRFTILRRPFWNIPDRRVRSLPKNLLITSGGSDTANITPALLEYSIRNFPGLVKKVIIGPGFKNIKEIRRLKDRKTELIYWPDASAMKKIMLSADIAISGGGVTLYELSRTGVATVGICFAKNQRANLLTCQREGFLEFAGNFDAKGVINKVAHGIHKLYPFKKRLSRYNAGKKLVDGLGCRRILDFILRQLS